MIIKFLKHEFQYRSVNELKNFIGKTVWWIDLFGNVRMGMLQGTSRPYVSEACNPYADTVKIKLV